MRETGYTCPKCGSTEGLRANGKVQNCDVVIHADGWEDGGWFDGAELPDWAQLKCDGCGHAGMWYEFDDGYARYGRKALAAFVHCQLESCARMAWPAVVGLTYEEPDGGGDAPGCVDVFFRDRPKARVRLSGDDLAGAAVAVVSAICR